MARPASGVRQCPGSAPVSGVRSCITFWQTHFPPNGWGCHCRIVPVDAREYAKSRAAGETEPPAGWDEFPEDGDPPGVARGFGYAPGASLDNLAASVAEKADSLAGSAPRAIFNQIRAELTPSAILKVPGLDADLLADVARVKRAEHYIGAIRPAILGDIAEGGIRGNAALVHELTEVEALRAAGLNVYDPDDIDKIVAAFRLASETSEPETHIPWHLLALRAEVDYAVTKLAARNIEASSSEVARGLYGVDVANRNLMEKMYIEMHAIGAQWSDAPARQEVIDALSL